MQVGSEGARPVFLWNLQNSDVTPPVESSYNCWQSQALTLYWIQMISRVCGRPGYWEVGRVESPQPEQVFTVTITTIVRPVTSQQYLLRRDIS